VSETNRSEPRPLWEQEATWCIHFSGIMQKTCEAGVSYDDPRFGPREQGRRELPCLKETPTDPTRTDLCPLSEYLTEEQARAKADEVGHRLATTLARMAAGYCPECDQKVESKRQIGRCIYAAPCGHRLGQGRLR
jgi:hypothetical protein